MQLKRFLDNSYSVGKGAVKLPIDSMITGYKTRYEELRKKYKRFKFTVWYVMPGGRTIVHFKIPSETVDNFFYDVLLELDRKGDATAFEDCHIKIFSNCPSFVYTYAYVFYNMKDSDDESNSMIIDSFDQKIPKDRLLVNGSEKRLGELPVTMKPEVRNPLNIPLFDKSVYFAVFYLLDELDFKKTMYSKHITSMRRLLSSVEDFDVLMKNRKAVELKRKAKIASNKADIKSMFIKKEREINSGSGVVNKIKPMAKVAKSKKISKTTAIKSIKPIKRK